MRYAVDVLGEHYNTWASSNARILNSDYGKELWYTEGIASTNIAKLAVNSNGSGLNGTNGALDVCNRIINGYYNGRMTMYEYQPAVADYMTVTNTETGDYSIVICNDSDSARCYTFTIENMAKADAPIYVWETRGPDEGQEYDANYLRNIGVYKPVEANGKYSYSVEVKPYSIVTVTTLDKTVDTSVYKCGYEDIPLDISYSDDFEYTEEFLTSRGYAPFYTTDYGGAFEVVKTDDGNVLMHKINIGNKPADWRFSMTQNLSHTLMRTVMLTREEFLSAAACTITCLTILR